MPINVQAQKWYLAYFGIELAILATFFKILTLKVFFLAYTFKFIGKPNEKSIGHEITIIASKKATNLSSFFFFKVSVTKRLITSATINIFP